MAPCAPHSCNAHATITFCTPAQITQNANGCALRRGTGNNAAVQKLLHFAVTDVSDDVRRAAVTCLGFLLMGDPAQCPKIVALLAESFNPHMR